MKKILSILILFCLFISCKREEQNFSKEMIEKLAFRKKQTNGLINIPRFIFLDLYVLTNKNEVHQSNNNELLYLYNEYYHKEFKSFKDFLNIVLNEEFILDKKRLKKPVFLDSFKLNQKIINDYSNSKFEEFFKKYTKQIIKNRLILNNSNIEKDEYLTIVYIFFKNRYDISSDCYLGIDYIRKREDSFK